MAQDVIIVLSLSTAEQKEGSTFKTFTSQVATKPLLPLRRHRVRPFVEIMFRFLSAEDISWKCNCSLATRKIQCNGCVGGWTVQCSVHSPFWKRLRMAETLQRNLDNCSNICCCRTLILCWHEMWVRRGWKAPSCRSQSPRLVVLSLSERDDVKASVSPRPPSR